MKKWQAIAERMAFEYGTTTPKGNMLMTVAALCSVVEVGADKSIYAYIPSAAAEYGLDFTSDIMENRLLGLSARFPDEIYTRVTHDLHSVAVPNISKLLTAIRTS